MEAWDEIRTAFHVARLGTVSGAADALGVHHATVIRHIDALEKRLGAKLFQRHARGYSPTEAGQDLMQVAQATDDQFAQLASRVRGRGETVTGDLVVTSIESMSPWLAPALAEFQKAHPGLTVRFVTDDRVFRLEYGEAHVAVRAGAAPDEPDNVVQKFGRLDVSLFASKEYLGDTPLPLTEDDLKNHTFVGYDSDLTRAPFHRWMQAHIPAENITMTVSSVRAAKHAIIAGAGIGFQQVWEAAQCPDLVQVMEPRSDWSARLWLVTHVDLHRSVKVQAILKHLKDVAASWNQGGLG